MFVTKIQYFRKILTGNLLDNVLLQIDPADLESLRFSLQSKVGVIHFRQIVDPDFQMDWNDEENTRILECLKWLIEEMDESLMKAQKL